MANSVCSLPALPLAKESFQYPETKPLFKTLEEISQRSSLSRGRSFEDVIRASVAALAAETMEEEYFAAIADHCQGSKGKRGVDLFAKFFGQTVDAISQHDRDVLGDLFQSAISHGENAFFMTPQPISQLLSDLVVGEPEREEPTNPTVNDPCCGTGIMLIEAGRQNPEVELCGTDLDSRCADIAAINLGLRSRYGWIVCGNSLSREVQYAYRIGHFYHESPNGLRRGVVRKVDPKLCLVLSELQTPTQSNPELFTKEASEPREAPIQNPNIIEIPRWVLQMEQQQLADAKEQEPNDDSTDNETASSTKPPLQDDRGDRHQQSLF